MLRRQRPERGQDLLRVTPDRYLGRGGSVGWLAATLAPGGASPGPVDGPVHHDRAQPGAEPPAAVEAIEAPDRGEERFLGDVLGGGVVVDDQERGSVGPRPEAVKQRLEVRLRAG